AAGDSDERTQSKLVKFLSDARDPRGEACLVKALKDFKPEGNEEDVRWASRGIGGMKLKSASAPLMEGFTKLRPSKLKKVPELYPDVHDAMMDIADPAWESQLIGQLGHPVPQDKKDTQATRDEVYWQVTAAEILGVLKSGNAVKPLIKTVLSPAKADVALTSINALIKIGKPAMAPTLALLKGDDKDLVEYSKGENMKASTGADGKVPESAKKAADTAHIGAAAIILAAIGRDEAAAPLIDALRG